jgi:hypothetical protein
MAADPVPDGPWDMADPRRDGSVIPYTDADTEALVDELVDILIVFRCPMGLGDAAATVSVLTSLEAEIAFRLPDAVADARDQGYTWDEIAMRLATTASAARHRHAAYARFRRELLRAPSTVVTSDTHASDVGPASARRETPA